MLIVLRRNISLAVTTLSTDNDTKRTFNLEILQNKLQFQVKDLGKQISHLLKQTQTSEERDVDVEEDDDVVTFSNVDELQQRNSELLTLVREMSAERESAEIHKVKICDQLCSVVST